MAKSFKNGISLHHLLEASPLSALEAFLAGVDQGQYAAIFSDVPWPSATDEVSTKPVRDQLFDIAGELKSDAAVPLVSVDPELELLPPPPQPANIPTASVAAVKTATIFLFISFPPFRS